LLCQCARSADTVYSVLLVIDYICAAASLEILAAGGEVPDPFGGGPIGDVRRTGV